MVDLVALRLVLPSRLAREPLDTLLLGLTPAAETRSEPVNPNVRRDLLLAERGLARLPGVVSTCLYRSLARYAILRRLGAAAEFVMGVSVDGLTSDGHAWIELAGQPFEELADVRKYTVTFRYPPAPPADRG